jgi:uncharacterized protein (DUF488 family)
MPNLEAILTIGVYGMSAEQFFGVVVASGTDCFVDVRQRRGLRGSQYAFANSARLQSELASRAISYVHVKQLAPTDAVRQAQRAADTVAGVAKRVRLELGEAFKRSYCEACLATWSVQAFLNALPVGTRRPMLFCVERLPQACHRSLVADWLSRAVGAPVEHHGF